MYGRISGLLTLRREKHHQLRSFTNTMFHSRDLTILAAHTQPVSATQCSRNSKQTMGVASSTREFAALSPKPHLKASSYEHDHDATPLLLSIDLACMKAI